MTPTDAPQRAVQLSLFNEEEITRPEYNIGKWAGVIFTSPRAKNLDQVRVFTRTKEVDGEKVTASITVSPKVGKNTLTTTSYKVYLALTRIWVKQGRPTNGHIEFSDRQLAKEAGWQYSGIIAKRIKEQIEILQGTGIDWLLTFKKGDETLERLESLNILQGRGYLNRDETRKGKIFGTNHHVRLNSYLVENMLAGANKPINSQALFSIKSSDSSNLYVLLDVWLSGKPKQERRAYALLRDDLGLQSARYEQKHLRKAKLKSLQKDLHGKPLVRGHLEILIEPTADGEDWKLVARKILPKIHSRKGIKNVCPPEEAEAIAEEFAEYLLELPKSGTPKISYMAFLARYIPKASWFEALSIVKSDYRETIKKYAVNAFIFELKRIADSKRIPYPKKQK